MRFAALFREPRLHKLLRDLLPKKFWFVNLLLFLLFLWMLLVPFFGTDRNYAVGDIAGEDIRAARDVQYVDVSRTEFKLRGIRKTIPPVFTFDGSVRDRYRGRIAQFITFAGKTAHRTLDPDRLADLVFHTFDVRLERETLQLFFRGYLPGYWGGPLIRVAAAVAGVSWFDRNRDFFLKLEPYGIILTGDLSEERVNPLGLKQVLFSPVDIKQAQAIFAPVLREYHAVFRKNLLAAALAFGGPNVQYDKDRSRIYEKNILSKVAPELQLLKKDEIVVRRGDRITAQQQEKIRALNVKRARSTAIDAAGYALLLLLFVVLVSGYLRRFFPRFYLSDIRFRIVIVFFAFLNTLIALLFRRFGIEAGGLAVGVFIPLGISGMTICMLMDERLSYFTTFIYAVLAVFVTSGDHVTFLMLLGSGWVAARVTAAAGKRTDLWRAGLVASTLLFLLLLADFLLKEYPVTILLKGAGFGFLNGILSAIIAVGLIPFFETFLRVPTRFKLLELADTNSPLLKRMQIEATGTYTHSIIVGNLAESAAANIGANALLARVGSYYHDIGKIDHASYFSENQQGMENRHKDLKPTVSRSILIAHVRKGAELARREGLPQVVIDFIEQHHGTTIMKFFYHQALDASGKEISKEDFRYPGPRPQTKETAIVMLADSVEAASKSLKEPTPQRLDNLVTEIIRGRFLDGELDESSLTLRDLGLIARSFIKILNSLFHSRVEYPEEQNIRKAEAVQGRQRGKRQTHGR